MKRPLIAVLAVVLALGAGAAAVGATTDEPLSCTLSPVEGGRKLDCPTIPDQIVEVPGPTVTVTETVEVPVPGPTVTVTVTASPSPTSSPTATAPPKVLVGANPTNPGGESAAAAQGVVDKYGAGATVRQFHTSITTSTGAPNWPAVPDGSTVHRSYKPPTSVTDAQIDAIIRAARGHWLTFWHESDNDGMTASQISARVALMNRLYDRNVALGHLVTVVHVVTGQFMSDYRDESWKAPWRGVRADLIGVDMDGPQGYGVTYADELRETLAWLQEEKADGYVGWTVPEFGVARTSSDASGSGRLAWMQREVGILTGAAVPPRGIHWYDYAMTNDYRLTAGSPEYTYWRSLVAAN